MNFGETASEGMYWIQVAKCRIK